MISPTVLVLSFSFIFPQPYFPASQIENEEGWISPIQIKTPWDRTGSIVSPDIIKNDDLFHEWEILNYKLLSE